jgi:hypothetical protein
MNMRNLLAACLFCGIALMLFAQQPVPPPPKPANDAPANAAVLKLLQVGMPESVVLDKIRAITDKFDTSIDALVALKQAGATEAELKAIMAQGAAPAEQPPTAAPADTGPTLAETMQFIQAKLQEFGKTSFAMYTHDNADGKDFVDQATTELSNVVADPAACRISYHRSVTNNSVPTGKDGTINLREVQNLIVMTGDMTQTKSNAEDGHPTRNTTVQPPIFVLAVRKAGNQESWLYLSDEEMADRVAKAMLHAVELCGGGNKDKF